MYFHLDLPSREIRMITALLNVPQLHKMTHSVVGEAASCPGVWRVDCTVIWKMTSDKRRLTLK